jgi:hypothetical protein
LSIIESFKPLSNSLPRISTKFQSKNGGQSVDGIEILTVVIGVTAVVGLQRDFNNERKSFWALLF